MSNLAQVNITPDVVSAHGLTTREYETILTVLGRTPTITELGVFSVMWSEHCSYKHTRPLLGTLPTKGPRVLHGPGENAGAIDIGNGWACVFKIESHNHPSAVEPFQGAATGVGGILRDIFAMGAFPVALLDSLRFGPPSDPHNKKIISGVIAGISHYGNCVGVPTIGGEFSIDPCYTDNCLVNVMCIGLAKHDALMTAGAKGVGNLLLYYGNATGRDGVHGATFASTDLSDQTAESRSCVQVGDPFMEKKILEATLDLIRAGVVIALQDMGAAGLTCSSTEMAYKGGLGLEMDLDLVPQRAAHLSAYEILLSESQERMLAVISPEQLEAARAVLARWELDAHVIGHTTDTGRFVIQHAGAQVVDIPLAPICSGAPKPEPVTPVASPPTFTDWRTIDASAWSWSDVLLEALASPHFASKSWIYRQYDHQVQTNTIVAPGAGAGVIRARGAELFIAATSDGNGIWCALDPYEGTKCVTAEAARNLAASGARPVAVTNNLNFGNPRTGPVAWQIAESIRGLGDACRAFDTPVTGGNVSLYNESARMAVFPTPVVGMVGIIHDAKHITRAHFSAVDEAILLLGPSATHAGGSRILRDRTGALIGPAICCDLEKEMSVMNCLLELIHGGFVSGASDISDGGLLLTLSEMALANDKHVGFRVRSPEGAEDVPFLLSEEPSRYVITCSGDHLAEVLAHCHHAGVEARVIGRTADNIADIAHKVSLPLDRLRRAWMTEP